MLELLIIIKGKHHEKEISNPHPGTILKVEFLNELDMS